MRRLRVPPRSHLGFTTLPSLCSSVFRKGTASARFLRPDVLGRRSRTVSMARLWAGGPPSRVVSSLGLSGGGWPTLGAVSQLDFSGAAPFASFEECVFPCCNWPDPKPMVLSSGDRTEATFPRASRRSPRDTLVPPHLRHVSPGLAQKKN
jgi:hypothetical protein